MYKAQFLDTGKSFNKKLKSIIEESVIELHKSFSEEFKIDTLDILFMISKDRVVLNEYFVSSPYEESGLIVFIDDVAIEKDINKKSKDIKKSLLKYLYAGLFSFLRSLNNKSSITQEEELLEAGLVFYLANCNNREKYCTNKVEQIMELYMNNKVSLDKLFNGDVSLGVAKNSVFLVGAKFIEDYLKETKEDNLVLLDTPAKKIIKSY